MRTKEEVIKMWEDFSKYVIDRYLDPKNEAKGSHKNIEPLKNYKLISTERLEAEQAYRKNEGDERELSELGDATLLILFRANNIIEKD
jgi:hypothetical protein